MTTRSKKSVRRAPVGDPPVTTTPVTTPVTDVDPPAASTTSTDPVARYTWAEIRARVTEPDAATLARYRVAVAPKKLIAEGALIRSERILTDLRLWLGEIIAWWSALDAAERELVDGFSDARLRVVTHHAFVLIDLADRATKTHAHTEHAAAVALADEAYAAAQNPRQRLRAVLDQAASVEVGFAQAVAAADAAASDAPALDKTLGALVTLARDTLRRGGPVAEVLAADDFTDASIARYEKFQTALRDRHERTRGTAGGGPVTQAELDQQDGTLLVYMEGLRKNFRALRADDRRAPQLVARSTANYFGRRARKPAAAAPAPVDGGKVPTPTK